MGRGMEQSRESIMLVMRCGLAMKAVVVVMALVAMVGGIAAEGSCFPAIYNFGDSTSDSGGIHATFPQQTPAEFTPYGDTFPGKPTNKYSDGRLLIDFVSQALGLKYLSSIVQPVDSDYSNGANFATAGATIMPVTYLSPFPLPVQYLQFLRFQRDVFTLRADPATPPALLARLPTLDSFSKGLYTIALGGNDFTYGYTKGQTIEEVDNYLPNVAEGVVTAVKTLYAAGARNFMISDIEPHGCLPYILTFIPHKEEDLDDKGCIAAYNEASERYNDMLRSYIAEARKELPDIKIHVLSTFTIKTELISNLAGTGFTHALETCCGVPSKYNYHLEVNCGKSRMIKNVTYTAKKCDNPNEYIVWDGVHDTEAANRYIANKLLTGKYFDVPFPELTDSCTLQSID